MRLTMIGSGYVGLVSGACLADFGHQVVCVDTDETKIAALKEGKIPIFEPGLDELVSSNARIGRLSFSTDLSPAVEEAEVIFIAVGTPSRRGDGHADLSYVHEAARSIAPRLKGFTVVVTKSTVPVGTGDEIEKIIRKANPAADVAVVSNPEFLREGAAIDDFRHPDRIVVGLSDERARAVMTEVYRPLYLNQAPMVFTDRRTSELIKYAGNAFLAMKITFINEIAELCERTGANVQEVARGIGLDKRIGPKFLNAGPGYGGSCFPKDTVALIKTAQDFGSPMRLIETTEAINTARKRSIARKIIAACGGDVSERRIAVLGLTFKPNTDDMREAPSLAIIQALQDAGATIAAYDPEGMENARTMLQGVEFGIDAYDVARDADALVIVTEWNAFRAMDFRRLKQVMRTPLLVDLRNIYRKEEVRGEGFAYVGVGRPAEDYLSPLHIGLKTAGA
ncbi:MAG: UDP-glucose/GDP-mannose dehydrogenase family protein [Alphaproteobacteria bacterium]|nr:UDP-glucose/GDP-mannose dehydrogenase family protein [Alphaproteobacteria bacterium]MBU0804868.1 UDP-glucose/GDP-mannose dehydrogenase family protein [Alphaproteobacteria bacterium]MBU0871815.1 UDP-glucose/GDP-mannose dehydrogenase family protein [Alphaproteobacteria bacterium]MBU1403568.1 UDP-glucose/GDP-mannose dehydrogenase family protein [Alphaproteobacteria bacterium]MBU1591544.1 UDP-glucose/GDP-mannose dehydrogenase family protein [Alphaproteobacteria bacterium]